MPAFINILYLRSTTGTDRFDENYYLSKHLPLAQKSWGPHGLLRWQVAKLADDPESPYYFQTIMEFESIEAFDKAAKEHGAAIFEDVPNFTDLKALLIKGSLLGSWQK
jgi:uncharacterized protein (TIGR02118 family)